MLNASPVLSTVLCPGIDSELSFWLQEAVFFVTHAQAYIMDIFIIFSPPKWGKFSSNHICSFRANPRKLFRGNTRQLQLLKSISSFLSPHTGDVSILRVNSWRGDGWHEANERLPTNRSSQKRTHHRPGHAEVYHTALGQMVPSIPPLDWRPLNLGWMICYLVMKPLTLMTEVIATLPSARKVIPCGNTTGVLAQGNIQRATKALLPRSATLSVWLVVLPRGALYQFCLSAPGCTPVLYSVAPLHCILLWRKGACL